MHTRPHQPDHRPTTADEGFTLIELLVVVTIIGILAGIAIPAFLHQRATAHDAAVKSDLRNIGQAVEGAAAELEGELYRSSGAYDVVDGHGHGVALSLSPEVGWGITGTAAGFCVAGYTSDSEVYTPEAPLFYDSLSGGLTVTPHGACDSSRPPTMSAPVTGGTGGSGSVASGKNWLTDSGFQRPDPAHLNVGLISPALNLAGKGSAYWSYRDIGNPAGTRALQVSTRSGSTEGGIIVYPASVTPMPATHPIVDGQQYTVSAWVRAPKGQPMWLVARVVDQGRAWRAEYPKQFSGDGTWQRVSQAITGTPTTAGFLLAMHVQTGAPFPAVGTTFEVAGPQVEVGPAMTAYEQSAP